MQVCSDLVIKLNARILYGPAYADDQDFHRRLMVFANGVDGINSIYFDWPRSLWRLVSLIHPTIRGFYANLPQLKKKLLPDIRTRIAKLQAKAAQGEGNVPISDEDVTFMTSLIQMHIEEGTLSEKESDLERLCMEAVFYTYEFWGPIMPTLFFMLMEIGRNPGYLQALREEISSALESNDWSSDFLARTPKLESFIREVLRLYVPAQCEFFSASFPLLYKQHNLALKGIALISTLSRISSHRQSPNREAHLRTVHGYEYPRWSQSLRASQIYPSRSGFLSRSDHF